MNPGGAQLHLALKAKDQLQNRLGGVLTSDDYWQMDASLRWLGFFAGVDTKHVRTLTPDAARIKPAGAPILAYEHAFLDWLFAMKESKDQGGISSRCREAEGAMTRMACHQVQGFGLAAVARHLLGAGSVQDLENRWRPLVASLLVLIAPHLELQDGLAVDLGSLEVRRFENGQAIRRQCSPALARFLALIEQGRPLSAAVAMKAAFGIGKFTEIRHAQKLGKLLVAVNKWCRPWLEIRRQGDTLFVTGEPSRLRIVGRHAHGESLAIAGGPAAILGDSLQRSARAVEPSDVVTAATEWIGRKDLQRLLGISAATTVRRIRIWQQDKLIEKIGEGRATRYRMTENLKRACLQPDA